MACDSFDAYRCGGGWGSTDCASIDQQQQQQQQQLSGQHQQQQQQQQLLLLQLQQRMYLSIYL
jgi:hypothetical protein